MSLTRASRRRPLRRATAFAGVAVLAPALAACGGGDGAPSGSGGANFVGGTGQITEVAKADRVAAPDISGETVDGGRFSLADHRGEVVVVNVWGSWCSPCRAEAKHLVKVAEDTEADGVRFVGINTRDYTKDNARAFEENFGVPYPSLYDPDGKLMLKFPKGSLNPQGIPNTLILDRDGRIAVRILKAVGEEELREALDPIVAEK